LWVIPSFVRSLFHCAVVIGSHPGGITGFTDNEDGATNSQDLY